MELAKGSRKAGQKEDAFQRRVKNLLLRKYFWKSSLGHPVESQIFQVSEEGRFVFPGCQPVWTLLSRARPRPPGRSKVSAGKACLGECARGGGAAPVSPNRANIWGGPPSACHSPLLTLCLRGRPWDRLHSLGSPRQHGGGDIQRTPPPLTLDTVLYEMLPHLQTARGETTARELERSSPLRARPAALCTHAREGVGTRLPRVMSSCPWGA